MELSWYYFYLRIPCNLITN